MLPSVSQRAIKTLSLKLLWFAVHITAGMQTYVQYILPQCLQTVNFCKYGTWRGKMGNSRKMLACGSVGGLWLHAELCQSLYGALDWILDCDQLEIITGTPWDSGMHQ